MVDRNEISKINVRGLKLLSSFMKDSALEDYKEEIKKMLDELENDDFENYEELQEKLKVINNELYERAVRDWYD